MHIDLSTIKNAYFSCEERKICLKEGEILLHEGNQNQKLYIVHKGLLCGFGKNPDGSPFKLFKAGPDSFVGLVSFFSTGFTITATVIAEEPTELYYLDWSIVENSGKAIREFLALFMPVVVY
ncbi:MAG: cyclic nucleotide-binding domain-containing protein, partial [Nitrospinota bacterium]